jgi:hypothetical protein
MDKSLITALVLGSLGGIGLGPASQPPPIDPVQ